MYLTKSKRSPYYQLIYFVDGKRTSVSTKCKLKSEALKFLMNFNTRVDKPAEVNSLLLSEFEGKYLDNVEGIKSKSYIRSIKLSFRMLRSHIGDIPIQDINNIILENFISTVFKRAQSASGLYYRTLKAAFRKAMDWEYLSIDPFAKVKTPRIPKSFPIFITKDDFGLIIKNTKDQLLKDIFIVAFYTGMRLGELVNMKWDWVDFTQNQIVVKNSNSFTTKSKRERIIPIHPITLEVLKRRKLYNDEMNNCNYIFSRIKGIMLNDDYVSKQFKLSVRKSFLDDKIKFHTLRHSFASGLVQKGVSLIVVKELLGHESIKTTLIYSHLDVSNINNAISKL